MPAATGEPIAMAQRPADQRTLCLSFKSNQIKSNLFPNAKTVYTANM